jgi:prevent-host-death family protein
MLKATISQLRRHAKKYFDAVEAGETVEVLRHGKPIALLSPLRSGARERWRRGSPLKLKGVSASKLIIEERRKRW